MQSYLKLFENEIRKLVSYRTFWIILMLYTLQAVGFIVFAGKMNALIGNQHENQNSLYTFPQIWKNLTLILSFGNFFLAFLVIMIISNEFKFKTYRQQIINGLSHFDLVLGKFFFIGFLALNSSLLLFVSGIFLGVKNTPNFTVDLILKNSSFLLYFFIRILTSLSFAALIIHLVRRSVLSIILLLLWYPFEFYIAYKVKNHYINYFPMVNLSKIPEVWFQLKTLGIQIQASSLSKVALLALAYTFFFHFLSWISLKYRNL